MTKGLRALLRCTAVLAISQGVFAWADPPATKTEKPGDEELHRELLDMAQVDQEARQQLLNNPADNDALANVVAIDQAHVARMKAIVQQRGWPGKSRVGDDGAHAAWLLVQHADLDVEFQIKCLALMKAAVKRGDAAAKNWAYLVDRVRVNQKRPQVYGTQFRQSPDGGYVPAPIEDEPHVDERRKSVGLSSLAEYAEQMRKIYGSKPSPAGK